MSPQAERQWLGCSVPWNRLLFCHNGSVYLSVKFRSYFVSVFRSDDWLKVVDYFKLLASVVCIVYWCFSQK